MIRPPGFWFQKDTISAWLLEPLSVIYRIGHRTNWMLARPWRAPVPVICVGNLVVGGAGKTPVAISIAARLAQRGRKVHLLTRGYGGRLSGPVRVNPDLHDARDVGDEPLLLAGVAPTWVSRDRRAGAKAAVTHGADILVMDDGFQNPGLVKDLAIIVVDGNIGFGNCRTLPAGPLREPIHDGLVRARATVIMGEDRSAIEQSIADWDGAILKARVEAADSAKALVRRKVVAMAGIGHPEKFFETLNRLGAKIISSHAFPDHHRFSAEEMMALAEQAAAHDATLVTTAKDYVRLSEDARSMVIPLPVDVVWSDPETLDRLLETVL